MSPERNSEYQQFLDTVNGRKDGEYNAEEETIATGQEIGWWKQHQTRRAIRHLRTGKITPPELSWLNKLRRIKLSPNTGTPQEDP